MTSKGASGDDIEEAVSFTEKRSLIGFPPKILKTSAGEESCCIFRVPQSLAERNPGAYEPKVVSIGPYHHGRHERLKMIEEHKPRFEKLFLEKAEINEVGREELLKAVEGLGNDIRSSYLENFHKSVLFKAVAELENDIRSSYSEGLNHISSEDLVNMMVLDGCFILMLFLIVTRKIKLEEMEEKKDPILTIPWILPSIRNDLLLFENQVPFSVLQILFEKSKIDPACDINQMIFSFFNYSINKPEEYWLKHKDVKAKHLLDLIRKTYIYKPDEEATRKSSSASKNVAPSILSAKRLRMQGIKFRPRKEDSVLAISLKKNKLKIPRLILDGFITSFFLNSVAFEQLYTRSSNHITSYVVFMGCLLDGEEDATFLTNEKRIIENYYGSELEVSQFFKKINKDILFDVSRSYLEEVFKGINEYTSKSYTGIVAEFRHTHFHSPWTCLSSCAVLLVIIIAALQLLFAILSYRHDINAPPRNGN